MEASTPYISPLVPIRLFPVFPAVHLGIRAWLSATLQPGPTYLALLPAGCIHADFHTWNNEWAERVHGLGYME